MFSKTLFSSALIAATLANALNVRMPHIIESAEGSNLVGRDSGSDDGPLTSTTTEIVWVTITRTLPTDGSLTVTQRITPGPQLLSNNEKLELEDNGAITTGDETSTILVGTGTGTSGNANQTTYSTAAPTKTGDSTGAASTLRVGGMAGAAAVVVGALAMLM